MRRPTLPLWLSAGATYAFLYAPILVVAAYSFNASRLGARWGGFTTRWYSQLLSSSEKVSAAQNTLVLAVVSTAIATILGTMLGYGLSRYRFPGQRVFSWLMSRSSRPRSPSRTGSVSRTGASSRPAKRARRSTRPGTSARPSPRAAARSTR